MKSLLKNAKMGDSSSIQSIIQKFIPLILKESSKYIIKCYDYEDLVQHGYLSVIKAINMFNGEEKAFTPYCIQAIRLNHRALLKGEIKHHREIPEEKDIYSYKFTIEDELIAYEKIKELYVALDKLLPIEKVAIEGFYLKNKSMSEVAVTIDKSYNATRYIKEKALKKLRHLLDIKSNCKK